MNREVTIWRQDSAVHQQGGALRITPHPHGSTWSVLTWPSQPRLQALPVHSVRSGRRRPRVCSRQGVLLPPRPRVGRAGVGHRAIRLLQRCACARGARRRGLGAQARGAWAGHLPLGARAAGAAAAAAVSARAQAHGCTPARGLRGASCLPLGPPSSCVPRHPKQPLRRASACAKASWRASSSGRLRGAPRPRHARLHAVRRTPRGAATRQVAAAMGTSRQSSWQTLTQTSRLSGSCG